LEKGDVFYLKTESVIKQTTKTLGKELKQDTEQTTVLSFRVKEVKEDKSLVVEEKVESLKSKSSGPADPAEAKVLEQMQGAKFDITFGPRMEILAFEGYDELLKKLSGDNAGVRDLIRDILPEEAMKKSAREALTVFLPDKAVNPGEKWTYKGPPEPLGPLGSLKQEINYVYDGNAQVNGKEVAKISFTSAVTYVPPKGSAAKSAPFQIKQGNLSAENAKGLLYFDANAGRLVLSESRMTLRGALTVQVSGTDLLTDMQQEVSTKTQLFNEKPMP
jgi:hypothetical protein